MSDVAEFYNNFWERSHVLFEFRSIAEAYPQYDCIFIEENTDNLFQGLWFEFGNYDEFKKIPLEDFVRNDIGLKELEGRKNRSGLIVYAPMEYVNEKKYQLLAHKDGFGVYKMMDGVIE